MLSVISSETGTVQEQAVCALQSLYVSQFVSLTWAVFIIDHCNWLLCYIQSMSGSKGFFMAETKQIAVVLKLRSAQLEALHFCGAEHYVLCKWLQSNA